MAFYGTNGVLLLGHTVGWRLYGPRNKLIEEQQGDIDLAGHHTIFFDCVRGRQSKPNADVNAGILSAGIVPLANIAARMNRVLEFDPEANALVTRAYRSNHWAAPK